MKCYNKLLLSIALMRLKLCLHKCILGQFILFLALSLLQSKSKFTLSSFSSPPHRRSSTPSQTQTGLEQRVFLFTINAEINKYSRLLYCPDQIVAVIVLSQHWVFLSKPVRPRASCGARCMGHTVWMWSEVCIVAAHKRSETPFVHKRMELTNTILQSIEPN